MVRQDADGRNKSDHDEPGSDGNVGASAITGVSQFPGEPIKAAGFMSRQALRRALLRALKDSGKQISGDQEFSNDRFAQSSVV